MAEYFRDAEGQDVLLFVDNIFRFTQVVIATAVHLLLKRCTCACVDGPNACCVMRVVPAQSRRGSAWAALGRQGFAAECSRGCSQLQGSGTKGRTKAGAAAAGIVSELHPGAACRERRPTDAGRREAVRKTLRVCVCVRGEGGGV